jgi:hypothetical protein
MRDLETHFHKESIMGLSETQGLVSDLANHGFREDLTPTMELPSIEVADPITGAEAAKLLTDQRTKLHSQYQTWMQEIETKIKERAKSALRAAGVLLIALLLSSSANAYPLFLGGHAPATIQQPAGQWVLYNRPTWAGNVVFGPIWVFIPNQPRQLQQSPAPAFQPTPPAVPQLPNP